MSIWFEESIPVEKSRFVQMVRNTLPAGEKDLFDHFVRLLDHYCHCKFKNFLDQLYAYYEPFNPNTNTAVELSEEEEEKYAQNLIEEYKKFLEEAQYQQIGEYDIRDILRHSSIKEMKVVFPSEKYWDFLVYFRDEEWLTEYYRSWRTLWLKRHSRRIPYYKRLAILFRPFRKTFKRGGRAIAQDDVANELRDITLPQPIIFKLFQNIRQDYLPIIFPGIFLKISFKRKLYLGVFLTLGITLGIIAITVSSSIWYNILSVFCFLLFLHSVFQFDSQNKQYYRKLLSYYYYKNVSNNSGVLSYLIGRIEEETYKQYFLLLHAFWNRSSWALYPTSIKMVSSHLENYLLEYFGVQSKFNLENIVPELLMPTTYKKPVLTPLLQMVQPARSYLKKDAESDWLDVEAFETYLPTAGILEIAPGTKKAEKHAFHRDEFLLHIQGNEGIQFSHPAGSAIRWLLDTPYQIKISKDCPKGSDFLIVSCEDAQKLPLKGIGKIQTSEETFEFRYHHNRNDTRLFLDAGLRYRHTLSAHNPVLVRPILPYFHWGGTVPAGTTELPVHNNLVFPQEGLLKIEDGKHKEWLLYRMEGNAFRLSQRIEHSYNAGTKISLSPPTTYLKHNVSRKSWLLPITESKYFSTRGTLILSPGTEREERTGFRGETYLLRLDQPLVYNHGRGSIVQLKDSSSKSSLIDKASKNTRHIMIQGIAEDVREGEIIIDPGEQFHEIRRFSLIDRYFELSTPTQFSHLQESEVWESKLESPLRYEVFQGSHLITVEDASSFPLSGTLEIQFNGKDGVKEVFPFMRTQQCSNTLMLKAQSPRLFPAGTSLTITAVEVVSDRSFHYHDKTIQADFSCVMNFPEQGKVLLEPGNQREEAVSFQRYSNRLYLKKALQQSHSAGTAISCSSYMESELTERLQAGQNRILLDFSYLLPDQGCLYLKNKEGTSDIVWYRKLPRCIILNKPCTYHHPRETPVLIPAIADNVSLAEPIEKGRQKIKVIHGQELPEKGKLEIRGLFHSILVEFTREQDTLYLQSPIAYHFSKSARIKIPDVYLINHLCPGMDYIEVSDASFLPHSGDLVLESTSYTTRKQREKISFQYQPNALWLNKPLEKSYEPGTIVFSPELMVKGAYSLDASSMKEVTEKLSEVVNGIYQGKVELNLPATKIEPSQSQLMKTVGSITQQILDSRSG